MPLPHLSSVAAGHRTIRFLFHLDIPNMNLLKKQRTVLTGGGNRLENNLYEHVSTILFFLFVEALIRLQHDYRTHYGLAYFNAYFNARKEIRKKGAEQKLFTLVLLFFFFFFCFYTCKESVFSCC
jgi:hypothetical protein